MYIPFIYFYFAPMKQSKKQLIIKSYLENESWTSSYDFIASEHNASVSYVKSVVEQYEQSLPMTTTEITKIKSFIK